METENKIKAFADYAEYHIEQYTNGSVSVLKNGEPCQNGKTVLREIACQSGFVVDDKWSCRQFTSKLIQHITQQ